MSAITTHVLDIARGRPAASVPVTLEIYDNGGWQLLGQSTTDADGHIADLISAGTPLRAGTYRLTFDTGDYFARQKVPTFYPAVTIAFHVQDSAQRHHVPLLLSPYGFSTYRGC